PAGLDALATAGNLALELVRPLDVDPEQAVAIGARARAAAAGLDAEQVVEDGHDEVVVQVAALVPDDERDDRAPRQRVRAEDVDRRSALPPLDRAADERLLALADRVDPDRVLQLEDEAGPDRLDDGRRAALLPVLRVRVVDVLERVDVHDRPAAGR